MLLAFFSSLLSFSICSAFFALVTAMVLILFLFGFLFGDGPTIPLRPPYALAAVSTGVVSTEIPGPMEDERYAPLMYLPFAAAGLARTTLVITAVAFSTS